MDTQMPDPAEYQDESAEADVEPTLDDLHDEIFLWWERYRSAASPVTAAVNLVHLDDAIEALREHVKQDTP